MAKIEFYHKPNCPFCIRARALLESKNVQIEEINLMEQPEKKAEMIERSGRQTVPQIFIDGQHIGGCDDLFELEESKKLDQLLTS